jgi:hypothetical protein
MKLLKIITIILVLFLAGCKEEAENSKPVSTASTQETKKEKTSKQSIKEKREDLETFLKENTSIVKVIQVRQQIDNKNPSQGPFEVIEGINNRGEKFELWIKEMKIHSMVKLK